jgi:hypothetical protein
MGAPFWWGLAGVRGAAEGREGRARANRLDGQLEVFAEATGEFQAGAVVAAFQVADGLVVHSDGVREVLTAEAGLGTQAVVEFCRNLLFFRSRDHIVVHIQQYVKRTDAARSHGPRRTRVLAFRA